MKVSQYRWAYMTEWRDCRLDEGDTIEVNVKKSEGGPLHRIIERPAQPPAPAPSEAEA